MHLAVWLAGFIFIVVSLLTTSTCADDDVGGPLRLDCMPSASPSTAPTWKLKYRVYDLRSDINESEALGSTDTGRNLIKDLETHRSMIAKSAAEVIHTVLENMVEQCGTTVCRYKENTFRRIVPERGNNATTYRSPHIVLTFADDWGRNDLGKHSDWMTWATPYLDGLAQEGVELTLHFLGWKCAPSRASLLTGRYTSQTGFWDGGVLSLPLTETTLAQELQSVGYRTRLVGKW